MNFLKKISLPYILRLIFFWITYFSFFRILFFIYHYSKIPNNNYGETLWAFLYALPLDISTACWLSLFSYFLWIIQAFYRTRAVDLINKFANYFLISIITILCFANVKIFEEWGTLISNRIFDYLLYPTEITSSISWWTFLFLLVILFICIFIGIKLYKLIVSNFSAPIENNFLKIGKIIITSCLLFIGIRGGFQLIPVNESSVYYSTIQVNNYIAINPAWYFVHSVAEANDKNNPYSFYENINDAKRETEKLFVIKDTTSLSILKVTKPNIIFIILESWTADLVEKLGGEKGITPHFTELTNEGLLFTQMYSSGYRSEQGLISIMSGFPAPPINSIITTPTKAEKLPSLNIELSKLGYQSSFYYGGEAEFGNMKTYLLSTNCGKIIDKRNFKEEQLNSKWGAHDEYILLRQIEDLKKEKQPFVSTVFTLSTHEPFEVPVQSSYNGNDEANLFKNAAHYSDYCLNNYFNEAKKQAWYNNTLFVLIADHGHRLPMQRDLNGPESKRITALITGGALKDSLRGKTIDKICNQHDITTTLLNQLNIDSKKFTWSKNIFNGYVNEFAYYSNENALGWVTPKQQLMYYFASKSTGLAINSVERKNVDEQQLQQAKAYLQTLYQTYLEY